MLRNLAAIVLALLTTTLALADDPQLVTRGHAKVTLSGAQAIIAAAKTKAEAMKLKVNIAVVDDGGHLLAFARMDGARPASSYTAMTKATAAATLRAATGPFPAGAETADVQLSIAVENAAQSGGGKMTSLYGGVPIEVDGQVIGAVGVGGATGQQDAEIARAGIAALVEALAK